ncbi:MAG: dephospho-CoA kinase [Thermodesulfovibrionales bacterium]|nr:dephospho-CoA kinase [Thermodesulfovibrionales bacterium]
MTVVGLTGNYGMGKSMVSRMFKEQGAVVINTDDIVKELLTEPSVIYEIKESFGDDIVEAGKIKKELLARLVFQHPYLRISLEDILHPRVFKRIDEELARISTISENIIVIIEAPVLFERGYQNRFDKIITVYSSEDIAIDRLKEKGISEEDTRMRLKSQFPVAMKLGSSDFIIDNNGSIDNTMEQVKKIYKELMILS